MNARIGPMRTGDWGLGTGDWGLGTGGTGDWGLGTVGLGTGDCGLWAVGCGLWAVGCGLWAVGCGLVEYLIFTAADVTVTSNLLHGKEDVLSADAYIGADQRAALKERPLTWINAMKRDRPKAMENTCGQRNIELFGL